MLDRLANELAHEAFHRMRYFGPVMISQYEEYWAFYIGSQVVKADYPKFAGIDPQDPQQLQTWFTQHSHDRLPAPARLPRWRCPGVARRSQQQSTRRANPVETQYLWGV